MWSDNLIFPLGLDWRMTAGVRVEMKAGGIYDGNLSC